MKLFFDTETTGRANFRLPLEHHSQPRMVSIAMVLMNEDGSEVSSAYLIIRPEGFTIPPEATEIHGITTEQALSMGVRVGAALEIFRRLAIVADSLHAFNFEFDDFIVSSELLREKFDLDFMSRPAFCEMIAMTPICELPPNYRGGEFKWPNLKEAHQFAFGEGFDGAHDAMADVRALIRVHQWRIARQANKSDSVHTHMPFSLEIKDYEGEEFAPQIKFPTLGNLGDKPNEDAR